MVFKYFQTEMSCSFSGISAIPLLIAAVLSCTPRTINNDSESKERLLIESEVQLKSHFRQKNISSLLPTHNHSMIFSPNEMYFSLGEGLYVMPVNQLQTSQWKPTKIRPGREFYGVHYLDGMLFVIDSPSPRTEDGKDNFLHVSVDNGKSFTALDEQLRETFTSDGITYTTPLEPSREILVSGNKIYYSAGNYPNIFVSTNVGKSWQQIVGTMTNNTSYQATMLQTPDGIISSADVNDMGRFNLFELSRDGLKLKNPQNDDGLPMIPTIGYRQAYIFKKLPGSSDYLVGMEEGLVRGNGRNWKFVLENIDSLIVNIAPLPDGKTILVSGNAKHSTPPPYLGISRDGGTTWKDISSDLKGAFSQLEPTASFGNVKVRGMEVGPDGKIYIAYIVGREDDVFRTGMGGIAELVLAQK